ncbi:MAG: hypothetical protein AMS19_00050 [Gemmatimonas sp. SG8_23]|jgi:hypothetical protein|nr:MAG: hypothetical protein AMS19_00050 [Gemmatimonas sp. SG8_23]
MSRVFRRYGSTYQSVTFEFEGKALNEVGFRRDNERSIPVDELDDRFELLETVHLSSEAEGDVQSETEQLLLDRLLEKGRAAAERLPEDGIAIVENERGGRDQPKPRQKISNVVVEGENRMRFHYVIEPPLRISLYRPRG